MSRLILILIVLHCGACSGDEGPTVVSPDSPHEVVPRMGRTLALDVNEADNGDYGIAFALAQDLGIDEIKQSWDWDGMETETGFDFLIPDIANLFFPMRNTPVSLVFRPVNTNLKSVPDELKSLELDDPLLISRFNSFLDSIRFHTPDLAVNAVFIGNEIDIYLGTDPDQWAKFTTFFEQTSAHARKLWPSSTQFGTIATLQALNQAPFISLIQPIHEMSDIVAVTYYPLENDFKVRDPTVASTDFDRLVELYGSKEIRFTECGYPTSMVNASSEQKQKMFITEVFKAWDKHQATIRHIDFTWMHDLSQEQTDKFKGVYGITTNTFGEYLRTLGFRTHDGQDKPGFLQLREEARARGW